MPEGPKGITQLLHQSSGGNKEAFDQLVPIVYDQLHKMASRYFASERPGHTLRTTALLNEAYLKLVESDVAWTDRVHFFAVAARVMRQILVDHARTQTREKRGGDVEKISLEQGADIGVQAPAQLLDLDRALQRLAERDRRKSEIVELLFFGGLTYDEASAALEISPATLHRELKMAKAWLYKELAGGSREVEA
jgi:RNA polymerase sigma factor (TIGR02999 family)